MFHTYSYDAIVYDAATNSWGLRSDYARGTHRLEASGWDDDGYLGGDSAQDELGDDAQQTGSLHYLDGTLFVSGRFYSEEYITIAGPGGQVIRLDLIEVAGQPVAWIVSAPLQPGTSYAQTGRQEVTPNNQASYQNMADVPCLAAGTLIATEAGDRPIDRLRAGDRVLTRDSGFQPVLWAGRFVAEPGLPGLCVIDIAADAFGEGMPSRRLRVTPNHRMLLASPRLMLQSGECEMFAAAKFLTDGHRITAFVPAAPVALHHLLFAEHEVILAEGLWTESLFAGDTILASQPAGVQRHLRRLVAGRHLRTARACLSAWEVRAFRRPGAMAAGERTLAA